ncbi:MAG TPA: Gfo/Idh/MocA family oxidoreductase [Planctomycetota bacterium]|jgi:predicted dehydrogenase
MTTPNNLPSRRGFLKGSGATAAAAALAGAISAAKPGYTAESNTIKIALVGCGGRGTGAAAQALSTKGPVKLHAMADVFSDRLNSSMTHLKKMGDKVDVPQERQFLGFDGYKKAIDSLGKGDVVLLTTPPAFRPMHVEYAVERGVNVFMEKSFAVDGPGLRRMLKAGKLATEKNLKIAGGLMSRHSYALNATIDKIHEGLIGDVITCWAYRVHAPVGYTGKDNRNELMHQIRNYSNYTWLNGSFILDWLIHNIDVCCWVKNAWPVSAQGQGGRQVRTANDQLFDHYAVEYTFPDGTRMFAQGRHMDNCWGFFGDIIHGTKGSARLGEGQPNPYIYKGYKQTPEELIFEYKGPKPDFYQVEHDLLFDAIRNDKPYNETERCVFAAASGILGRMAAESGQTVTWDQMMNSNLELAPGLDKLTVDSDPPVKADADGRYPVAMPGITKAL